MGLKQANLGADLNSELLFTLKKNNIAVPTASLSLDELVKLKLSILNYLNYAKGRSSSLKLG